MLSKFVISESQNDNVFLAPTAVWRSVICSTCHIPGFCLGGLVELDSRSEMEADAHVLFFSFLLVQTTKIIMVFTVQQRRGATLKTQAAASPPARPAR